MKKLAVIGTRPQILKVDPNIDVIVNTGQHYDKGMASQHLTDRKVKPKYNLECTSDETGMMLDLLRPIIRKEEPDVVIVYGDTNSTLAGTLAAVYEQIPVAHVEAGLRSHDLTMPEEINRIVADRLATWKFCPTLHAKNNLVDEGISDKASIVGDVSFDTLKDYLPTPKWKTKYGTYVFASVHRRENLKRRNLKNIMRAFELYGEPIVFTEHPHTKRIMKKYKLKYPKNVEVIKPLGRKQTLYKVANAKKVVTDSGGLTREAYWFLRPVVILRNMTEWQEIVDDGWGKCTGTNTKSIVEALEAPNPPNTPMHIPQYGAIEKINTILEEDHA